MAVKLDENFSHSSHDIKKYKANETHLPLEKQTIHKRPLIKEKKQIRLSPIKDKAKKKIPK